MATMRAWTFDAPAPIDKVALRIETRPRPEPGPDEVVVRVRACGVCRTDLHLVEGDLAPRRVGVTPGHQIVGEVVARGADVARFEIGHRVGGAWLRRTCGSCRWCRSGRENLCPESRYTGWDADGGFAEYAVLPAAYAYQIPDEYDDEQAAPLLCAGIIGYRALRRAQLPPGGRLGIYGFGASAHITAQIALAEGAELYVLSRGQQGRDLATAMGAAFVGGIGDRPPAPLDSAIVFAPAGEVVPDALESVGRDGTVAIAGIHLTEVPPLTYERHLFYERNLRSVTSNTRRDGEELLRIAARMGVRVHTTRYPFDAVDQALRDLAAGAFSGAAVVADSG
jgi:alcohol dehydrogenase, propanol-preferring